MAALPSMSPTVVLIWARAIRSGWAAPYIVLDSTVGRRGRPRPRGAASTVAAQRPFPAVPTARRRSRGGRGGTRPAPPSRHAVGPLDLDLVGELLQRALEARQLQRCEELSAAALDERADAQVDLAAPVLERDRGRRRCRRCNGADVGRERVGDEHGVREPVEREVGARREHRDQPAEHRAISGPGLDRDARRPSGCRRSGVGRLAHGAVARCRGTRAPSATGRPSAPRSRARAAVDLEPVS